MKNKCEELNMIHAWEMIENNFVYTTMPPQYPDPQRRCLNCGKVETLKTLQVEKREWQ